MGSVKDEVPVENKAVANALAVAGDNVELLKEIRDKANKSAEKFDRFEESEAAFKAIADTISMAEFVYNTRKDIMLKIWNGTLSAEDLEMLRPDYFNFQDLLAHEQLQDIDIQFIENNMQNVVMVYDVSENSEFVRGYIVDGQQLNPENPEHKKIIDLYDQCFHSWLVDNKMSSQDGVIYDVNKLDRQGNYTHRVKPEEVMRCLESKDTGLMSTIKKQSAQLGLELIRNQPDAPTPDSAVGG